MLRGFRDKQGNLFGYLFGAAQHVYGSEITEIMVCDVTVSKM